MGKAWTVTDGGNAECDACGRVYKRMLHHYPVRDHDSFSCACGVQLESWNSTSAPEFQLVSGPKKSADASGH